MASALSVECRNICTRRCAAALCLSVVMQWFLLIVYLFLVNFCISQPLQWLTLTVRLMFSFSTWLSIIPLISAVILYGILLGNSHLSPKKYYPSRFRWLVATLPLKASAFGMHAMVGFLTAWLYASYLHVDYRNLITKCYGVDCLNARFIFLIFAGISAGCYYFVKESLRQHPEVEFPIIHEKRWVKIRSLLYSTLYESSLKSFTPTIGFAALYWLFGRSLQRNCSNLFSVEIDDSLDSFFSIVGNLRLLFYTWILSSQILSNMHLMQRFFSLLLAERYDFVIEKGSPLAQPVNRHVPLVDALAMSDEPIMQALAAEELLHVANSKNQMKREEIYALSVPGGHPNNWNQISVQALTIITVFTEKLTASYQNIKSVKTAPLYANVKPMASDTAEKILLRQYNETYGIRRLTVTTQPETTCPSAEQTQRQKTLNTCQRINQRFEQIQNELEQRVRKAFHSIPGILFMFGEPEGAKTAFLLSNSQIVVWLTQALAGICSASLAEDKYGVVQSKLSAILKALLQLKLELDKLNNVNLNGKKCDKNLMCLRHAVKRSLYRICTVFGDYLREIMDDPQDYRQLVGFMSYQEV